MPKKILHILPCNTFSPKFINLIKENFDYYKHFFLLTSGMEEELIKKDKNIYIAKKTVRHGLSYYLQALLKIHQADKVILHGLFDIKLVILLFFTPWILKKCYWVMWGGDLYYHQLGNNDRNYKLKELLRSFIIKRIGNFVTYIEGDYHLAQQWYGTKGKYHECIMYLSNTFTDYDLPPRHDQSTNILIGNSADPSNNHEEILEKLVPYKNEDIKIYCPLSYGDQNHAKQIIEKGKAIFGEKFIPLTEFMPFDKYLELLANIDIAIFAHKRQQAMGNTISLLGLGKKVYMRNDITPWQTLSEMNLKIFNFDNIGSEENLTSLSSEQSLKNSEIIKNYFNKETLKSQLQKIFED
ncbi:MAG: TDP-N-acetylfucosamine:lipid II N-acetylfucosaminyltransferase [Thiofilum sp.]|uniref:TDP-N-acetylfucosamine:lipid II N-acetylfucosaminyltransferase n=1 Tax=Thiofilum sp. TaxID=2212733 RepID=UPI0025E0C524|nr:TDP-N-acetylfucosamine:lipid II N-acetylfucosaminyltransferase [Thiofilum sp.]MBK8453868.1 TDP-N-acetylfucosamine:lipid II N-acetylfucosaminyltransferase [Thiofilum sp.]